VTAFLKCDNVSLEVPVFLQSERASRSWLSVLLGAAMDLPRREFRTLLRDVSFEAHEGDRIAVLGRNGAGKSTLLRVLNGTFQPTQGTVTVRGSRQSLLNITLGFNHEATVKENIFLRGTAMGLPSGRLGALVDPILEFAGLVDKRNHRFKTLSAGQRMRLAFAISTAVQQDIMLLDEWIGTGDSQFLANAKDRLMGRMHGSRIVVLASHSTELLKDVCNKGMVLEKGRLVYFGDLATAIAEYHRVLLAPPAEPTEDEYSEAAHAGAAAAEGEAPGVFGCVETLTLADEVITLQGWAIQGAEAMPARLGARVAGQMRMIDTFERMPRPDVQRHFGLGHALCGYRARLAVPGVRTVPQLGRDFGVYGGAEEERLAGPFHMAAWIVERLQDPGREEVRAR
jgi:ABC-type polysaccharide/polyol phosphate transport system ATPase subunit